MPEKVVPFLHITNGDVSQAFYCEKLGFQLQWVYQPTPESLRCICVANGNAKLYLSEMDETGKQNKLVIWVDDLDTMLAKVDWQSANGSLSERGHFCTREMQIDDPDKNTILFCERPEDGPP